MVFLPIYYCFLSLLKTNNTNNIKINININDDKIKLVITNHSGKIFFNDDVDIYNSFDGYRNKIVR